MTQDELPITFPPSKQDDLKRLCVGMAGRLRDHIEVMGWTLHGEARWSKAFELLVRAHGLEAVQQRLRDYIDLKIDRPRVHNGDDFRGAWDWIGEQIAVRRRPAVVITPAATEIVTELTELTWPPTAVEQLPAVVQRSLDTLTTFCRILRDALADKPKCRDGISVVLAELLYPSDYVLWWFRSIHRKYATWTDWTGNLESYVWHPESEKAVRKMRAALIAWAGYDDGSWDQILKLWKAGVQNAQT